VGGFENFSEVFGGGFDKVFVGGFENLPEVFLGGCENLSEVFGEVLKISEKFPGRF